MASSISQQRLQRATTRRTSTNPLSRLRRGAAGAPSDADAADAAPKAVGGFFGLLRSKKGDDGEEDVMAVEAVYEIGPENAAFLAEDDERVAAQPLKHKGKAKARGSFHKG